MVGGEGGVGGFTVEDVKVDKASISFWLKKGCPGFCFPVVDFGLASVASVAVVAIFVSRFPPQSPGSANKEDS